VRKIVTIALGAGAAGLVLLMLFITAIGGGNQQPSSSGEATCLPGVTVGRGGRVKLSPGQRRNAATIVAVGKKMHIPARGQEVALATAMQESTLVNLAGGDRDSVGLFQQRPSQGWGTPGQIHKPRYAARQFYSHLRQVPGWKAMPVTDAAQAVQHSAFGGRYAKWADEAASLVSGAGESAGTCTGGGGPASGAAKKAISFAKAQLGKPYVWGATGPSSYDCSGLTMRAWQSAGVSLPRTSRQQYHAGTHVPISQARPGDLVFLAHDPSDPATIHHVVLVVNRHTFLEAPEPGKPVHTIKAYWHSPEMMPSAVRPGANSAKA
jgi:cell wall-associated NlpC family hydrolase